MRLRTQERGEEGKNSNSHERDTSGYFRIVEGESLLMGIVISRGEGETWGKDSVEDYCDKVRGVGGEENP